MRVKAIAPDCDVLQGSTMPLQIAYRKRPNARRYILRVNAQGNGGCVTIPRGGCWAEARNFARRNLSWLEERLKRWQAHTLVSNDQSTLWFRGEALPLVTLSDREVL